jgi:hypothetical protein
MTGIITPKIKKKLDKNMELANNSFVEGVGDGMVKVSEVVCTTPTDYIVDLKSRTCTCKRWEKSGIPCHMQSHASDMYKKAYGHIVHPCKDKTKWEKMHGPIILPPAFQRQVGMPTRCRRKAPHEVDARGGGKRLSRHGVIMHCSYCGEPDHNMGGCKYLKAGLDPPVAIPPQAQVPPEAQVPP